MLVKFSLKNLFCSKKFDPEKFVFVAMPKTGRITYQSVRFFFPASAEHVKIMQFVSAMNTALARNCFVSNCQSNIVFFRENIMKHTNRSSVLLLTLLLTSSLAFAGKVAPKGYLVDSSNDPVRSGFGLCWHTGTWTPADAVVEGCDDMLKPAPTPAPVPTSQSDTVDPAPATAAPAPAEAATGEPAPMAETPAPVPAPAAAAAPTAEKVTFEADAFFDFDKFALKPAGKAKLADLVSKLKGTDIEVVVATGHTDSVGTEAYNLKLSMRRANAVKAFLVSKGIPADRIFTEGKGESKPVASNKTSEGRAKNRRVEVEVVGNRNK